MFQEMEVPILKEVEKTGRNSGSLTFKFGKAVTKEITHICDICLEDVLKLKKKTNQSWERAVCRISTTTNEMKHLNTTYVEHPIYLTLVKKNAESKGVLQVANPSAAVSNMLINKTRS